MHPFPLCSLAATSCQWQQMEVWGRHQDPTDSNANNHNMAGLLKDAFVAGASLASGCIKQ